jgi:hypothetical protein
LQLKRPLIAWIVRSEVLVVDLSWTPSLTTAIALSSPQAMN